MSTGGAEDRRTEWFVPSVGPLKLRLFVGLLFLPYTGMVLAYTLIGSMMAEEIYWDRVGAILLIYFLALGIGGHALDAVGSQGRKPWGSVFSKRSLLALAIVSVVAAYAIGAYYMVLYTPLLWLIAIPEGFFLLAYNLEWFHLGNAALALFAATFLIVATYHSRLEDRLHRLRLWRTIKAGHLARRRLEWAGLPAREAPPVDGHPYAVDVDLIGTHSLLSLLDTTLSSNGRARLAAWLLDQTAHPPGMDAWRVRQALVRELAGLHLLRDRVSLEATLVGEGAIDGDRLIRILNNL